jgi:hypothetical protein
MEDGAMTQITWGKLACRQRLQMAVPTLLLGKPTQMLRNVLQRVKSSAALWSRQVTGTP